MRTVATFLLMFAVAAGAASAQNEAETANSTQPSRMQEVGRSAGRIASQPVRDVGVARTDIPPVLQAAVAAPYGLNGIKTCRDLSNAFHALTDVIGPDFQPGEVKKENRAGKLAEAGGKTAVNSLLPFRALVREVSGAAPAQRRLSDAVDAGYARRGFLRGVHSTRSCKTRL